MVTDPQDPRWLALAQALVRRPLSSLPTGRYGYLVYDAEGLAASDGEAGIWAPLRVVETPVEDDASAMVLEAGSLPELLLRMLQSEEFDPDGERSDFFGDAPAFLEGLPESDPLRAVDPELAAAALVLSERGQLVHEYERLHYCQGAVEARPGSEFIVGWDAVPPNQEMGWCILVWPGG